ncbi:hypothetical protein JZ751_021574 [Albula glossodonta]|uniref:Uncharacterized protein n=1 Tax=Albula glossodonta TaxID=121402 RepID=A0A8T2NN24_9TELE|nr:hypothetical protein JZ751_021574 [Albula glossodonta]
MPRPIQLCPPLRQFALPHPTLLCSALSFQEFVLICFSNVLYWIPKHNVIEKVTVPAGHDLRENGTTSFIKWTIFLHFCSLQGSPYLLFGLRPAAPRALHLLVDVVLQLKLGIAGLFHGPVLQLSDREREDRDSESRAQF